MFRIYLVLWLMLFTGVVVHILCSSNLNIAVSHMVKYSPDYANRTFVPVCETNLTNSVDYQLDFTNKVKGEKEWNHVKKNIAMSSMTWFLGIGQLIGGLLCQKYGGKVVFEISNLSLGLLNCIIPVAADINVEAVIIIRILQGILGGAGIGNAAYCLISKWVPQYERSKFVATMSGLYFGTAFSRLLNEYILRILGWRYVFYITGIITIAWCVLWHYLIYDTPQEHPHMPKKKLMFIQNSIRNTVSRKKLPIPWFSILTSVPFAVNTLCHIGSMWTVFTLSFFIPTYLTEIHDFPAYKIGGFSSLPYFLEGSFGIVFATIMDNILRRKQMSLVATRKLATFFGTIIAGGFLTGLTYGGCNTVLIITLLTLAAMCNRACLSGGSPNLIDLSPNFCAFLHGFQGFIGMITGYLSPFIVKRLTINNPTMEAWNRVFLITAAMNFLPGVLFIIFGQTDIQKWNYKRKNTKINKKYEKNRIRNFS